MPLFAIIDDTDPGLVYSGNWRVLTDPVNPRAPEYKGTTHVTNDPTASVTYQFHGSMLSAFGTIDTPATKGYANASFTVGPNNIVPLTHLNQTGDVRWLGEPNLATTHIQLFTSKELPTGDYTMTIKADGANQVAPFYLDFVTVQVPDDSTTTVERVIADDAQWDFKGTWNMGSIVGNYLTTLHQSQNAGGSATLTFEGTDIAVYGTLNGWYSTSKTLAYFQIDGGANQTALAKDIANDAVGEGVIRRNQLVWKASGLSAGTHTLTMVVPVNPLEDGPDRNPPWFLDYAVYGPVVPASSSGSSGVGTGGGGSGSSSGSVSGSGSSSGTRTGSTTGSGSATPLPAGVFTFSDEGVVNSQEPGTSSTPVPLGTSSSPSTVAIVGGVVGGLAILVILVGFLLWRKRRRRHGTRVINYKFEEDGSFPLDVPALGANPYAGGYTDSKDQLVGRKGGRVWRRDSSTALDTIGPHSPMSTGLPLNGSTVMGSVVTGASASGSASGSSSSRQPRSSTHASTVVSERPERERGSRPVGGRVRGPRREMDGGVRLASASDDEEDDTEEVLPPSYARYR